MTALLSDELSLLIIVAAAVVGACSWRFAGGRLLREEARRLVAVCGVGSVCSGDGDEP